MKKKYELSGMTCGGCVNSVKKMLLQIPDITAAEIQLNPPTAVLTMNNSIPLEKLQEQLNHSGNFTIRDAISQA
jgi:copper chaperone CopZ